MKDRNAEVDFHGRKRSNATHASTTDPDARLFARGEARSQALPHGSRADGESQRGSSSRPKRRSPTATPERRAALAMINRRCPGAKRITLGADKAYDTADFVTDLRAINVTPHIAVKLKGSALDGRTTRHAGYAVSQRISKRIEETFGWDKTVGTAAKTHAARHRPCWLPVHPQHGRLQILPDSQTARRLRREGESATLHKPRPAPHQGIGFTARVRDLAACLRIGASRLSTPDPSSRPQGRGRAAPLLGLGAPRRPSSVPAIFGTVGGVRCHLAAAPRLRRMWRREQRPHRQRLLLEWLGLGRFRLG